VPLRTIKARFGFLEETISKTFPSLPPARHNRPFSSTRSIDKDSKTLLPCLSATPRSARTFWSRMDLRSVEKWMIGDEQLTLVVKAKEHGDT
ncbi:hypothetical protein BDZ89DRAFT_1076849, partial [Hymenopellis radicata]